MFASVRNTHAMQLKEPKKEEKKMFESDARDSYQACGTFGFTRKDLKLSEDLTDSVDS